jgi:hypothetical protein
MAVKAFRHYATVSPGTVSTAVEVIDLKKSYLLVAMSIASPNNQLSFVKVSFGAVTVEASYADKVVVIPGGSEFSGDGVKGIIVDLSNSLGPKGVLMGATIYYEELG